MGGQWTSYTDTTQSRHFIAVYDLFIFANDILANFSYGEREIEINEKYRSLGWDDYWENNEWWADGKATTSL